MHKSCDETLTTEQDHHIFNSPYNTAIVWIHWQAVVVTPKRKCNISVSYQYEYPRKHIMLYDIITVVLPASCKDVPKLLLFLLQAQSHCKVSFRTSTEPVHMSELSRTLARDVSLLLCAAAATAAVRAAVWCVWQVIYSLAERWNTTTQQWRRRHMHRPLHSLWARERENTRPNVYTCSTSETSSNIAMAARQCSARQLVVWLSTTRWQHMQRHAGASQSGHHAKLLIIKSLNFLCALGM